MNFTLNRNHTVASVTGHSIKFVKDVPTYVPRQMHREVKAIGAVECDGDEVDFSAPEKPAAPVDQIERDELIKMALAEIREKNDRDDFTATGTPKVKTVTEMVGFDVQAKEVAALWSEQTQAAGGGEAQ